MSKSLGNGVDPGDIIESHGADAMRFALASMATHTQDVRMPVEKDPKTGKMLDDLKPVIEGIPGITQQQKQDVFETTARKVFPRLDARLKARANTL